MGCPRSLPTTRMSPSASGRQRPSGVSMARPAPHSRARHAAHCSAASKFGDPSTPATMHRRSTARQFTSRMYSASRAGSLPRWPRMAAVVRSNGPHLSRTLCPSLPAPASRCTALPAEPVGFQNSATNLDLGFYAARSYSLMRPPRTGRRLIRSWERSATRWSGRGGCSWQLRWGRRPL
jgi:hypothetical protein